MTANANISSTHDQEFTPIGVSGYALGEQDPLDVLTSMMNETSDTARELASFEDLSVFGTTPDSIRARFKQRYEDVQPDGIALNHETRFNAVKPPITVQYNHWCYKVLGPLVFTSKLESPVSRLLDSQTARNASDNAIEVVVTVTGHWEDRTTLLLYGMNWKTDIGISGALQDGSTFRETVKANQQRTITTPRDSTVKITVPVPPRSTVTVRMFADCQVEQLTSSPQVTLTGSIGANFPRRVKGAFFWFDDAASFIENRDNAKMQCIVKRESFSSRTEIGKPQPIAG